MKPIKSSNCVVAYLDVLDYKNDGWDLDNERFNNYVSILLNPDVNWSYAEHDYGFKIAILNVLDEFDKGRFIKYFMTQKDWQLISVYGDVAVFVKRGEFHLPDDLDQYEQRLKGEMLTNNDVDLMKSISQKNKVLFWTDSFTPRLLL